MIADAGFQFRCPADGGILDTARQFLECRACGAVYPLVNGVPVLIRDSHSVFAIADYQTAQACSGASYGRSADRNSGTRRAWRWLARRLSDTRSSIRHPGVDDVLACVRASHPAPRVLVIGSGGVRIGAPGDRLMHADVAFGPAVDAIADARDLPSPDGSLDFAIAVAVREYVADPQRCAVEIARVLAPGGHVYAVKPFLQPVHMGEQDFTRLTPVGHRRPFRACDEVAAGVSMGAGSMLAWAIGGGLLAVSPARPWQVFARMAGLLAMPLRWLDRFLPNAPDAAGGCWFFGRLRDSGPISDRELVQGYRRGFGMGPRTLPAPPR